VTGKPDMRRTTQAMRVLLSHKPREYALFVLGLKKGLETRELMAITAGQVRHLKPGEDLVIEAGPSGGRVKRVRMGQTEVEAIQSLLASRAFSDKDPIFRA
jgi:hypothetical protein